MSRNPTDLLIPLGRKVFVSAYVHKGVTVKPAFTGTVVEHTPYSNMGVYTVEDSKGLRWMRSTREVREI